MTGNKEFCGESVNIKVVVLLLNINLFVIALNDNNQVVPTTLYQVLIKLLTL